MPSPTSFTLPATTVREDTGISSKKRKAPSPIHGYKRPKWAEQMQKQMRQPAAGEALQSQTKRKREPDNLGDQDDTDSKRLKTTETKLNQDAEQPVASAKEEEAPPQAAGQSAASTKRKEAPPPEDAAEGESKSKRAKSSIEPQKEEKALNDDPIEILNKILSRESDGQKNKDVSFTLLAKSRILYLVDKASRGEIPSSDAGSISQTYGVGTDKLTSLVNWAKAPEAQETDIRLAGKNPDEVIDALSREFGQIDVHRDHLIDDESCHLILEVVENLDDCVAKQRLFATISDHGFNRLVEGEKKVAFFDRLVAALEDIKKPDIKDKTLVSAHLERWYALHPKLMGAARLNRLVAIADASKKKLTDDTKANTVCRIVQHLHLNLDEKEADIFGTFHTLCGITETILNDALKTQVVSFIGGKLHFLPEGGDKNQAIWSLEDIVDTIRDEGLQTTARLALPQREEVEHPDSDYEVPWW